MQHKGLRFDKRREDERKRGDDVASEGGGSRYIGDVIREAKKKIQGGTSLNGITVAMLGVSGCGKTTLLRKVFIDDLYNNERAKKLENGKEYIVTVFTESPEADPLQDLPPEILLDKAGCDEDLIRLCYQTNLKYGKKYNFVNILDDVFIKEFHMTLKMFLTMRNMNITSVVSTQYPKLVPPAIRISVYFTMAFFQNTEEGIEIMVTGWLSAYLRGRTTREKMSTFRKWTLGGNGHNFYLMDNLNHKCYAVDHHYNCLELEMIDFVTGLPMSTSSVYAGGNYENQISKTDEELNPTPEWVRNLVSEPPSQQPQSSSRGGHRGKRKRLANEEEEREKSVN
jgi:hypothetical protein